MARIIVELDHKLWVKILAELEDALVDDRPNGPANYEFEDYHPEMVDFNIRHLHDKKFIHAVNMLRPDGRNGLRCRPVFFREKGLDFLNAHRDDDG